MKKFISLLILFGALLLYPNREEVKGALSADIRFDSVGYLSGCTELSPIALTGAPVFCGGVGGINISNSNAITLFFNYESTAIDTAGYQCELFGGDNKFTRLGTVITPAITTFSISSGVATLSPIILKRTTPAAPASPGGEDVAFTIPVSYDILKIQCRGVSAVAGDTLSVAIRKALAP